MKCNIKHIILVTVTFIICALLYGCVKPALPPLSRLKLEQMDFSPLKDKVIIIDPGHGGTEHGAVGGNGLRESEVNLGVALYLWGLLQQAGANPILTRSADTSVANRTPFSLEEDLSARSALSNSHNADLFISIHHNSDINNPSRNEIQVYYKMADTGPSRDVAISILESLQNKLRVAQGNIFRGNYRVLRNTRAPAVLGESSFISNKQNEGMLSYQRTLQHEAEGYFDGILAYYHKGIPSIIDMYPRDVTLTTNRPEIKARVLTGTGMQALDPSSIIFKFDGERINLFSLKEPDAISFILPKPLQNDRHSFCIAVKNRAGNCSREACAGFSIASPPASIQASPLFPVIPPDGASTTAIDVTVLDYLKRPVMDGTTVSFSTTRGRFPEPSARTVNGHARIVLISDEKPGIASVTAEAGTIKAHTSIRFAIPDEPLFSAAIRDPSGNPVEGVSLFRNGKVVSLSDARGLIYDRGLPSGPINYTFSKKGYAPLTRSPILARGKLTNENILLKPIDGGVFLKRRIMLDPAGTSAKSLPVIMELREKIEHAGGAVSLTWENVPPQSLRERVALASKEMADLYLTVEITKKCLSAGYYFKSVKGKKIAEVICEKFEHNRKTGLGRCRPEIFDHYILIQTEMPAVWIKLPQSSLKKTSTVSSIIYEALLDILGKVNH